MANPNPSPYTRGFSFTGYQANNPTLPLPGQNVDIELDNLGVQVNRTIGALAEIRRADGKLTNKRVTYDSLDDDLRMRLAQYGNDITVEAYVSVPQAQSSVVPVGVGSVAVQGFADAGDGGAAIYKLVDTEPAHNAWWQDADGKYFELAEPYVNVLHFGAVGDNSSDDWAAIMAAIDYSVITGAPIHLPKRSYGVTKPVYLNGSAWVAGGKSVTGQQPFVRAFLGDVYASFGARIFALPGFTGEAVVFGRNAAGATVKDIHVDGANIANPIDISWIGTASGAPGSAAPACLNQFTGWFIEGAVAGGTGIRLDGGADTLIQNIVYRGGAASVGLSLILPGGGIWANNVHVYQGRVEIAAQNARISDSVLLNGLRVVSAALDMLEFSSCQFSTDPEFGYTIYSKTDPGSFGTFAMHFTSCVFLGGASHTYYFAGRWSTGAKFIACYFSQPTTLFFDTGTPGRWEAIGGATRPPVFDFEHCVFSGGGSAYPQPVDEKVLIGRYASRSPAGIVSATRVFPFDVLVGDGTITGGKLDAVATGLFARNQTSAVIPADAYLGLGYNRQALAETEIYQRGDIVRFVKWDGTTATPQYTFNNTATSAFYPGADGTRKLGQSPNRWAELWVVDGSFHTSDAREKTPLEPLTPVEIEAAKALARDIGKFKRLAAIAEKGAAARFHIGTTVQRVIQIMQDEHGLDPFLYGIVGHNSWDADPDEGREAGDRYSLRPDELLAFIARGQAANQDALEARLTAIEAAS